MVRKRGRPEKKERNELIRELRRRRYPYRKLGEIFRLNHKTVMEICGYLKKKEKDRPKNKT